MYIRVDPLYNSCIVYQVCHHLKRQQSNELGKDLVHDGKHLHRTTFPQINESVTNERTIL